MNGRSIGSLSAEILKSDGTRSVIWQLSTSQGDKWTQAQVPLPWWTKKEKNFQVCFVDIFDIMAHEYPIEHFCHDLSLAKINFQITLCTSNFSTEYHHVFECKGIFTVFGFWYELNYL